MKHLFAIIAIVCFSIMIRAGDPVPIVNEKMKTEIYKPESLLIQPLIFKKTHAPGTSTSTVKQATPDQLIDQIKNVKSWSDILNLEMAIYAAIITLGGYLSFLIPGLNKITDSTYRVLVFAVMVVIGVSQVGLADIYQGVFAYLISTSLYELLLKKIIKSPKPRDGTMAANV